MHTRTLDAHPSDTVPMHERLLIPLLGAMAAFGAMSVDMYLPGLPAIAKDLGATAGDVQMTLSAFFVGFAIGTLIYGPVSDRFGRRPVLLGGIAFYIATSVICAVAWNVEVLIAARFLHALGAGAASVVARSIVRDKFERDLAARAYSLMMIVMLLAPLLAPLAGGQVLAYFDWRAIFWVLSVFAALCLIAAIFMLPESNPPERRPKSSLLGLMKGYLTVSKNRRTLGCVLTSAMAFGGLFVYITASPFVYIELFGVKPEYYGFLFGGTALGLMIGSYANSRLVMRVGARRMLRIGTSCAGLFGLFVLAAGWSGFGGLPVLVATLVLFIGSLSMIASNAIAIAVDPFPQQAGTVNALMGFLQFAVGALAASLVGILDDGSALPMVGIIAACGIAAFLGDRFLVGRDEATAAQPAE